MKSAKESAIEANLLNIIYTSDRKLLLEIYNKVWGTSIEQEQVDWDKNRK